MRVYRSIALAGIAAAAFALAGGDAAAETATIRIAQQFGISYLPLAVMKQRALLEEEIVAIARAAICASIASPRSARSRTT